MSISGAARHCQATFWVDYPLDHGVDGSIILLIPVQSNEIFTHLAPGGGVRGGGGVRVSDRAGQIKLMCTAVHFMIAARQCCPVTTGGRDRFDILTLSFFCPLQQTWQEKERGITAETGKFPLFLPFPSPALPPLLSFLSSHTPSQAHITPQQPSHGTSQQLESAVSSAR